MTSPLPAFSRRRRGLLDFTLVLLCLWAAGYHTPLGAAVRSAAAWLTGTHTSAQPLLAYYTGGVYGAPAPRPAPAPPAFLPPPTPREALAWGVHAVLAEQPQARGETLAETRRALDGWVRALGSEEAAVCAFFFGEQAARFAVERVRAGGEEVSLTTLRRHLPPGQEEVLARTSRALMLGTAYALAWPVAERAPVTSPFGEREHPLLGGRRLHAGVDISLPVGTPVHAVAAGRVLRASEDAVSGRVVVLEHGHGVTTTYLHNSQLRVEVGEEVRPGQVVSLSGNTGQSSGPHLHYQLELGGEPVDPLHLRVGRGPAPTAPLRSPGLSLTPGGVD